MLFPKVRAFLDMNARSSVQIPRLGTAWQEEHLRAHLKATYQLEEANEPGSDVEVDATAAFNAW